MKRKIVFLVCASALSAGALFAFTPGGGPGANRFSKEPPAMNSQRLEAFLQRLPESERAGMKELAEKDPRAFRQAVVRYFEAQRKKEMEEILALRKAYLEAPPEKKDAIRDAIRAKLEAGFQRHTEATDRRIRNMEEQLADFQKNLDNAKKRQEERKKNKDAFLEKALSDITDPDKDPFPPPESRDGRRRPGEGPFRKGPGPGPAPACK